MSEGIRRPLSRLIAALLRPRVLRLVVAGLILALAGAYVAFVLARGPEKFTIIVLPDTQFYSELYPDFLNDQVDWILDQREVRNIVFVSHEGDVVEHFDSALEWQRAEAALGRLIGVVPFALLPGNHDLSADDRADMFNQFFPPERFSGFVWYGGSYPVGRNDNNVELFSAGGYHFGPISVGADKFLILHLGFCPMPDVIDWANQVLREHADRLAIVVTHGYLNRFGQRHVREAAFGCSTAEDNTQYIFDDLISPNPNVFLVLSGHDFDTEDADGEARRQDLNAAGRPVDQLLANYQKRAEGGLGWLRILGFNKELGQIVVRTYSPTLRSYEQDDDSNFRLDYPSREP